MGAARNYWITTATSGFPSSRPVWGIWMDPRLLFSTGSRIGRNLRRDNRVQVNLEGADAVVIIEGRALPLKDEAIAREWVARHLTKYHWEMPESMVGVYCVEPVRVLAWVSDSSGLDGGAAFANLSTEWRFAPPPE